MPVSEMVYKTKGGWKVRREPGKLYTSKAKAEARARQIIRAKYAR